MENWPPSPAQVAEALRAGLGGSLADGLDLFDQAMAAGQELESLTDVVTELLHEPRLLAHPEAGRLLCGLDLNYRELPLEARRRLLRAFGTSFGSFADCFANFMVTELLAKEHDLVEEAFLLLEGCLATPDEQARSVLPHGFDHVIKNAGPELALRALEHQRTLLYDSSEKVCMEAFGYYQSSREHCREQGYPLAEVGPELLARGLEQQDQGTMLEAIAGLHRRAPEEWLDAAIELLRHPTLLRWEGGRWLPHLLGFASLSESQAARVREAALSLSEQVTTGAVACCLPRLLWNARREVEPMARFARSDDPKVRRALLHTLGTLPQAQALVEELARDSDLEVRALAGRTLRQVLDSAPVRRWQLHGMKQRLQGALPESELGDLPASEIQRWREQFLLEPVRGSSSLKADWRYAPVTAIGHDFGAGPWMVWWQTDGLEAGQQVTGGRWQISALRELQADSPGPRVVLVPEDEHDALGHLHVAPLDLAWTLVLVRDGPMLLGWSF